MIKGSEIRKADHPIEKLLTRSLVAAGDVGRGNFARGIDAACSKPRVGRRLHSILSNGARCMRVAAPNIGRRSSICWLTRTKRGQKTRPFSSFLFREELFDHDNEPSVTHSYDCGAAWENFALQGFQQGLVVHGMQGFDYDRARKELRIPDEFQVEAMAAVGKPGPKELLPEKLQARESPNDRRKLSESVFEGPFRPK